MRLFQLSDIHVRADRPGWTVSDLFTKRITGWCNLALRKHRFAQALHLLGLMEKDILAEKPDAVVFSGDASALGFASEFRAAAAALHVGDSAMPPGIAVPGNHDHYIRSTVAAGEFERVFAPWQVGERDQTHAYPFAREIGGIWLIGVNSCLPNWLPWDAGGVVGPAQLARLDSLLQQLPAGPRVLVTHYPYCQSNGQAEPYWHALRDRDSVARILAKHAVRLWLCGHRHGHYALPPTQDAPFALVCAGSATQIGRAGYMDISIVGGNVTIQRRAFDEVQNRYAPQGDSIVIERLFDATR